MNQLKIVAGVSIIAFLVLCTTGCWTLSIHPIYQEEDKIFDNALVGTWGSVEDPGAERWVFAGVEGERAYRLIIRNGLQDRPVDPATDGEFEVHMVRIGEETYLDLYPRDPENLNDYFRSSVVNGHIIMKLRIDGGRLDLSTIDPEWLEKNLGEESVDLGHERVDEMILITAGTVELQEFLLAHTHEAFEAPDSLSRLDSILSR